MIANYYYGHGKLLLTSEYFVLDGARSLALPTTLGQNMSVKYQRSSNPKVIWQSVDSDGRVWFEASYDIWRFDCLTKETPEALILQNILRQARKQNIHFLRDEVDTIVNTRLEFPLNWGLGSSSSLIYNIAQWAYVSAFELQEKTIGGSGYDIACAQSKGPISFQRLKKGYNWEPVEFNPLFKNNLYFVYLNQKQNTKDAIERYYDLSIENKAQTIGALNIITDEMLKCNELSDFEDLVYNHELIISKNIDLPPVKTKLFNDFWGQVKSLGAWGGDFVLVTSDKSKESTKKYFADKGYNTFLTYDELINQNFMHLSSFNNDNIIKNIQI
ncbi:MAG: GYDIA family GHMP kinase [Bacteriovoracaceae bacterium]|jgi:mevalonate kinase|nr:GYDIA family GHMP kinase [Bacteriovoracaceae bacterium]